MHRNIYSFLYDIDIIILIYESASTLPKINWVFDHCCKVCTDNKLVLFLFLCYFSFISILIIFSFKNKALNVTIKTVKF